jgi:hypothetical protein
MPFRLEVERLERVKADLAAARGAAATAPEEAAQLRGQAVYGVASSTGMGAGRLDRMYDAGIAQDILLVTTFIAVEHK